MPWNRLMFPGAPLIQTNGTDVTAHDEMRIETVIIILWAAGGVLLLILLILLVCILKNNKKSSGICVPRERNVLRIIDRSHMPRDGRDNHGYSNYDDIWTWIPIIRGGGDTCTRAGPDSRVFTTSSSNIITENMQPPPYSVAISTPSEHVPSSVAPSGRTSSTSVSRSLPSLPPVSTHSQSIAPLHVPAQNSLSNEVTSHVVTVTSSSNSVVNNMVNEALRKDTNTETASDRRTFGHNDGQTQNSQTAHSLLCDVQSPHMSRQSPRTSNHSGRGDSGGFRRSENLRRPVRVHSPYFQNRSRARDFSYDANEGLYSFTTGENGRRVICDIPPSLLDEDGPPPYTPAPPYRGRNNNGASNRGSSGVRQHNQCHTRYTHQNRHNHITIRQAPIVSCDSDSF